ncbi:MAG: sensor histidine kinase [Alistipes indistinctus]
MKLKGYFWILAVSGTGAAAALGVLALPEKPLLFWSAEAGALIMLLLFIGLYRKLVRPYQLLFSGIDLLRQQDFASRLRPIRNREANQLIEVFNRMITQLKQERSEVREKNHFLDLLIQASPQGVIILDFDERISEINPAGLKLLKIEDFSQVKGLSLAEAPCELTRELAGLELYDETVIRTADRRRLPLHQILVYGPRFRAPFLLVEELTREVMKLEKESYERIIRMIAHEVNNSVGAIGSTLCAVSDALRQEERPGMGRIPSGRRGFLRPLQSHVPVHQQTGGHGPDSGTYAVGRPPQRTAPVSRSDCPDRMPEPQHPAHPGGRPAGNRNPGGRHSVRTGFAQYHKEFV